MRRWMALAVGLLVGLGLSATVQAQPAGDPGRSVAPEMAAGVEGVRLSVAPSTVIRPPTCDIDDNVDVYVRCLNRYLTKLARNINQTVAGLNRLYNECLVAVPVSQYGIPPTDGYEYTSGDGTQFLTTSLDFTVDPATDSFTYFIFAPPSCVEGG